MVLQDAFRADLIQANDEYELIAIIYLKLLSYKKDSDVIFVTRVGHLAEDKEYSGVSGQLESLRGDILTLARNMNNSYSSAGIGFEKFREKLIEILEKFQLPSGLVQEVLFPVCLFYVLEALDCYVENNLELVYKEYRTFGPLNKGKSKDACSVYLQERNSFLGDAYSVASKKKRFRNPLRPARIGSLFHTFFLVEIGKVPTSPKIIPVQPSDACREAIDVNKRIIIASIPYIGFSTFNFREFNKLKAYKRDTLTGPFYVEYPREQEDNNIQRVTALLDLAIQHDANIIVFPEFIMSNLMKCSIQQYLSSMGNKTKQLLFVIAGTCYHWDGATVGDNIMHIFNARGIELGCYYKYSPFLIQREEKYHGVYFHEEQVHDSLQRRKYCENCEILTNPGKECLLLDIDGIGRVLPAICRDIIDGEYTTLLANTFMPSLIMTPAWSHSVNSFSARFSSLADTIHTASLLCNCCNAVGGRKEVTIGQFWMPKKCGTHMKADLLKITREAKCLEKCRKRGGCINFIELSFSQNQPTSQLLETCFPQHE